MLTDRLSWTFAISNRKLTYQRGQNKKDVNSHRMQDARSIQKYIVSILRNTVNPLEFRANA